MHGGGGHIPFTGDEIGQKRLSGSPSGAKPNFIPGLILISKLILYLVAFESVEWAQWKSRDTKPPTLLDFVFLALGRRGNNHPRVSRRLAQLEHCF